MLDTQFAGRKQALLASARPTPSGSVARWISCEISPSSLYSCCSEPSPRAAEVLLPRCPDLCPRSPQHPSPSLNSNLKNRSPKSLPALKASRTPLMRFRKLYLSAEAAPPLLAMAKPKPASWICAPESHGQTSSRSILSAAPCCASSRGVPTPATFSTSSPLRVTRTRDWPSPAHR